MSDDDLAGLMDVMDSALNAAGENLPAETLLDVAERMVRRGVLFRPDAPPPATTEDAVERAALTYARAFVPGVQEVINDDAGDDPDPQWVYDRLIESLAVIDSLVAAFGGEYAGAEHATQVGMIAARAALAARGDAVTPGVTAGGTVHLRRCGTPGDRRWIECDPRMATHAAVPLWPLPERQVEGGEQRGTPQVCASTGPRIGDEGRPRCGQPLGHDGPHRGFDGSGFERVEWLGPLMRDAEWAARQQEAPDA